MKKVEKLANEIREEIKSIQESEIYINRIAEDLLHKILDKHAPIEKPFPKAMICNGLLVFFSKPEKGIVLKNDTDNPNNYSSWKKGNSCNNWRMKAFKDCEIQEKP